MKIRKLHIKNYKVFDDLELDFTDADGKTLDMIVLAGENGSGKTTILEIIRGLFDLSLFDNSEFQNSEWHIEVELSILEKIKLTPFFKKKHPEFSEYFKNEKVRILNLNPKKYNSGFSGIEIFFFNFIEYFNGKGKLTYLPVNKINFYTPVNLVKALNIQYYPEQFDELKKKLWDDLFLEISKNMDTPPREVFDKSINGINKTLKDFKTNAILSRIEPKEIFFKNLQGKEIKIEELSTGEKQIYYTAMFLSKIVENDSILMIDEPENAFHPKWQQQIVSLYRNLGENVQVFLATHSPHIIGACAAEEVFLLEVENNEISPKHPRYTKGHSIEYILELMGGNPRDTKVNNTVDEYIKIIRTGKEDSKEGKKLQIQIEKFNLDPRSEEQRRIELSRQRFTAIGK